RPHSSVAGVRLLRPARPRLRLAPAAVARGALVVVTRLVAAAARGAAAAGRDDRAAAARVRPRGAGTRRRGAPRGLAVGALVAAAGHRAAARVLLPLDDDDRPPDARVDPAPVVRPVRVVVVTRVPEVVAVPVAVAAAPEAPRGPEARVVVQSAVAPCRVGV